MSPWDQVPIMSPKIAKLGVKSFHIRGIRDLGEQFPKFFVSKFSHKFFFALFYQKKGHEFVIGTFLKIVPEA